MTLTCSGNVNRGTVTVVGGNIPDGDALLTRSVPGERPYVLRGGEFEVTTGGFSKDDTEPPFGVPLTYRLDMNVADRLVQRNLVPTPTFEYGVQDWLAGDNRTLAVVPDGTAHSAQVGHVTGNATATAPPDPPTWIGSASSAPLISGPYTLTPPTSGTAAIATGDWVYLFHQQLSSVAAPGLPVGFEQVYAQTYGTLRAYVWRRKRQAGDTGYSVPAVVGAASIGTAVWVRGASDTDTVVVGTEALTAGSASVVLPGLTLPRPGLVVSFAATEQVRSATPPGAASVYGATWQATVGQGTDPRNTVLATYSGVNAGIVADTRITYGEVITASVALQIGIQAFVPTAPRIIAKAKTTALPARTEPYLMTGRFRFNTSDLDLWLDVRSKGSWNVIRGLGTWGDIRGASAGVGTSFLRFFVSIADPATGSYYVQPVQVITVQAPQLNTWIDFSFFFTAAVDIPATAEIRFLHGTNLREYNVEWWLDEIGITSPDDRPPEHNNLYWFDGDSPLPVRPEDYLFPEGVWDAVSTDSDIRWAGTAGNSISEFYGPGAVSTTTICQLDGPTGPAYCDLPVFLNDPVSPGKAQWFSLIEIAPLSYAARQTLYDIINRAAVTAVSQVRAWATGELTLLTKTLAEREMTLTVLETGRILLYRNPDPAFPETGWWMAIGTVSEARIGPNQRRPERLWTVPFARVERPSGLIDSQSGRTWQSAKDVFPNWLGVKAGNENWLELLTTKTGTL